MNIKKIVVPTLLTLGIGSSFFREVVIANYFGSSRDVEIFRVAFALPYALFQSLGTVLVGGLLPLYLSSDVAEQKEITRTIYVFFFALLALALLTVPLQAAGMAPGFSADDTNMLIGNMYVCWFISGIASLVFVKRINLQLFDRVYLVSATSFLFSLAFMILLYFLVNNIVSNSYVLSFAAVASTIVVLAFYMYFGRGRDQADVHERKITNGGKKEKGAVYALLGGSVVYVILLSSPRVLDRIVASNYETGVLANLDYAMNFYVALGVMLGTSYVLLLTRKIALSHHLETLPFGKKLQIVLFPMVVAIPVVLATNYYLDELVELAYNRGAFEEKSLLQTTEILFWFMMAMPLMVAGMVLAQFIVGASVGMLVVIMSIKLAIKYICMVLFLIDDLSVFGVSTAIMELCGVVIMLMYIYARDLKKDASYA